MSTKAFEFVARYEALRTDDYLIELDEYRRPSDHAQLMIAHMRVFRWAPSVLRRMIREWRLFRTVCHADIYASPQTDEPKWHKMVRAVGFEFLTQVICNDGLTRPLYISRTRDGNDHLHNQQSVLDGPVDAAGRRA